METIKVNKKVWLVFDRYPQSPELSVVCFTSKVKAKKWMDEMNGLVDDDERNFYNLKEDEMQFYGPFPFKLKGE
jgi:hypothetical protein